MNDYADLRARRLAARRGGRCVAPLPERPGGAAAQARHPRVLLRLSALRSLSALLGTARVAARLIGSGLLCLVFLVPMPPARALDANGQIEDPQMQARFERITHELRCLVCQNESIADSNVELASDLRRQVREMLAAGKSDDAIFDFMTDRYGEFIRFRPPLEPKTLLIWGAPFIMLLVGAGVVYRIVSQRSRMPLDDEPTPGPL
jgi:cytochrome c-type biogenesis protein CcmH